MVGAMENNLTVSAVSTPKRSYIVKVSESLLWCLLSTCQNRVSVNHFSNIMNSMSRSPALKNDMTADVDVRRFITFITSCRILYFKYNE